MKLFCSLPDESALSCFFVVVFPSEFNKNISAALYFTQKSQHKNQFHNQCLCFVIHNIPLQLLLPATCSHTFKFFISVIFLRAECLFSIGPFCRYTPTHP